MPRAVLFDSMARQRIIGIVVGEVSGDILGAGLIRAMRSIDPTLKFVGIAGPRMKAEGCDAWFDMEFIAVMGIIEVLKHLPKILFIRWSVTRRFRAIKPDVFIGIDAPDFNLTLERKLKRSGIKTVHYVSPSVWAWKKKRVFKIKKATDLLLVFLPFEKIFYDNYGVPCQFIGHKMADDIPFYPNREQARAVFSIPDNALCLALLPGSRHAEVELLSADFLQAAQRLQQLLPTLRILVPMVNAERRAQFEAIKARCTPDLLVTLLDAQARETMIASDAALLASGTAALECMLTKCPMVVAYRLKPFTYMIAKWLVKIPYVSLPNILAGKELVPECIQDNCTPDNLVAALLPLLTQDTSSLKAVFLSLHQQLRQHADERAAHAVLALLNDEV